MLNEKKIVCGGSQIITNFEEIFEIAQKSKFLSLFNCQQINFPFCSDFAIHPNSAKIFLWQKLRIRFTSVKTAAINSANGKVNVLTAANGIRSSKKNFAFPHKRQEKVRRSKTCGFRLMLSAM